MNDLYKSVIASVVRWALSGLAGILVAHSVITQGQSTELIAAAGIGLASLVWAIYQKYRTKIAIMTALDLPKGSSPQELKAVIKNQ